MLFNGDIYSTGSLTPMLSTQSDTEWLFAKIIECNVSLGNELFKH